MYIVFAFLQRYLPSDTRAYTSQIGKCYFDASILNVTVARNATRVRLSMNEWRVPTLAATTYPFGWLYSYNKRIECVMKSEMLCVFAIVFVRWFLWFVCLASGFISAAWTVARSRCSLPEPRTERTQRFKRLNASTNRPRPKNKCHNNIDVEQLQIFRWFSLFFVAVRLRSAGRRSARSPFSPRSATGLCGGRACVCACGDSWTNVCDTFNGRV